jgi:hypothetical protein
MANGNTGTDFTDRLAAHVSSLEKRAAACKTEEATKMGLIVPMLQIWGYDPFNPLEVVPEYNADVGTKKKEKLDYAILDSDGNPIILIEAKSADTKLDSHCEQLFRYFSVCNAKIGILTNGLEYQFYSDTEAQNKMDLTPFLIINLVKMKPGQENQLKRFCKTEFNVDELVPAIESLARKRKIQEELSKAFNNPDDEFIKYFINKVYDGKVITKKVTQEWTPYITDGIKTYINEIVNQKLKNALEDSDGELGSDIKDDNGIVTTDEEMAAHRIVQAICAEVIPVDKVVMKDAKSYCAILFNNNNRKPIIRLYFDGKSKFVQIFDTPEGTKFPISRPEDLYGCKEALLNAASQYAEKKEPTEEPSSE